MASVLNTPGYAVFGSVVHTNGVQQDICRMEDPLTLTFTMTLGDPIGDLKVQQGVFNFDFCLYSDFAAPVVENWNGPLFQLPAQDSWGQTFWVALSWSRAGDVTGNTYGLFNFKPRIIFPINRSSLDQSFSVFAVCPDDHYIYVVE